MFLDQYVCMILLSPVLDVENIHTVIVEDSAVSVFAGVMTEFVLVVSLS